MKVRRLLYRALGIAVLFVLAHALGWRAYLCVLSGAAPASAHPTFALVAGCAYLLLYFGVVLVAPVLVLAAGFETAWRHVRPGYGVKKAP